jgi:hypothetical protein
MAPLSQLLVDLVLRWRMVVSQSYFEIGSIRRLRASFSDKDSAFRSITLAAQFGHAVVALQLVLQLEAVRWLCANPRGHKCFRPRIRNYSGWQRSNSRLRVTQRPTASAPATLGRAQTQYSLFIFQVQPTSGRNAG